MPTSEKERLELHLGLRQALGENLADMVMEQFPPSGWTDVARSSDLHVLSMRVDLLEKRINGLTVTVRFLIGAMLTVGSALFVMLVQLNQAINSL